MHLNGVNLGRGIQTNRASSSWLDYTTWSHHDQRRRSRHHAVPAIRPLLCSPRRGLARADGSHADAHHADGVRLGEVLVREHPPRPHQHRGEQPQPVPPGHQRGDQGAGRHHQGADRPGRRATARDHALEPGGAVQERHFLGKLERVETSQGLHLVRVRTRWHDREDVHRLPRRDHVARPRVLTNGDVLEPIPTHPCFGLGGSGHYLTY